MSDGAVQRNTRRYAGSPERYTPTWLMARIRDFLGPNMYDPCPASQGHVQVNGLSVSWARKRVYCNPPYGRGIASWVIKAMTEPTSEVILLVPAYTDARWFAPLFDHTLCFLAHRLTFERPDGFWNGSGEAPHSSVLVYRGRRSRQFADAFSDLGPVVRAYRRRRATQPELWEAS